MSFTSFSGISNPFFSAHLVVSPNTATFGTLSALGQVPLVGISGKFATYSVLNNGVELATGQTASTYTITGLSNNVQIGPVTLVPYDSLGVAGSPFTVKGGSGGGKIYTWAQANAPAFSLTTSSGTTLACTGTFSKVYVTFSPGTGTPASGTLINVANSISQLYSGMVSDTSYNFSVYPVNGDGIPASASGTNVATASVTTSLPTLWVTGGIGTGNTLAYSTNGLNWTGRGNSIFSSSGQGVAYSAYQKRWVAAGYSGGTGNTLAYSTNGITWTGLGKNVISTYGYNVAYSAFQNRWIAGGEGGNSLAYSTDGIAWTGLGTNVFSSIGRSVAYSKKLDRWIAGGSVPIGTGNALAYSMDGITWTGLGQNIFSNTGLSFDYSEKQACWVAAGGYGGNTLAYSTDGIAWSGLGRIPISTNVNGIAYSAKQDRWVANGQGIGNVFAYSMDGITWTGLGLIVFSVAGRGVAYSATLDLWVAAGQGGNSFAYSTDGIAWTGLGGTSIYGSNGSSSIGVNS